jgi:cytochrome c-type biogenesis protein CcmH
LSIFIAACGALLLFSALFYSFPSRRSGAGSEDLERANLESFRLRQAELSEEGDEALREDARLRLLEEEQARSEHGAGSTAGGRQFPRWLLLPLVAAASALLYYQLGGAADVLIARELQSVDEETTPAEMAALIDQIETRSNQRPDNLHYMALLGRYYMGQQDYGQAADSYQRLTEKVPEDAQSLAYAAQARYLARGRQLDDDTRMLAERALAVDPHQRTALGLLGMASYEQGQYRAAVEYWERLLVMETPGSESARMIAGVIESARLKLGDTTPASASPAATPAVASTAAAELGVTVQVSLPDGARVGAGDTVFVLARNADSDSRMPIAVQRLQAGQLPVTLRLDDSNSMAGQKLSDTASVLVLVQVSPDGRPGEANATWLGRAGPLVPDAGAEPVQIILAPRES